MSGGEDPQRDNDIRAARAARALTAYANHVGKGSLGGEVETAIADLLGDLRHMCDALDVDWDGAAARAESYHHHEVLGEL